MGFLHGLLTASLKQILFNCLCDFAKNLSIYLKFLQFPWFRWIYYEKNDLFVTENHYFLKKHWNFHQKLQPNVTKKSRAVNIAQWNIDFQYQYQYIEDIDAGINIEFRFLRLLILILILRLEKILVLILTLILIVFQRQYWYWSWYWKWNFRKYWYWYWTTIWYCPASGLR